MLHLTEGTKFGLLALFASVGTLLCCALPIALVALGMGSVVAAVTLQLPVLVTLSDYKIVMFGASAGLLALSAWLLFRRSACPSDPLLGARCQRANAFGKRIFWAASSIWLTGLAAAYLLLPLRQMFNA